MGESPNPSQAIDLGRYPVGDLAAPEARAVVEQARRELAGDGVAILPGFARPQAVSTMATEALALRERAHLEDVWGTPYLSLAEPSYPEGHPRRTNVHSKTWVAAYDLIAPDSVLRQMYEWDPLLEFVAEILEKRPLYRMADPLGALNVTVMDEDHEQCWHYDNADFVVSLAIQSGERGGLFECAPFIREPGNENYDEVARVLRGEARDRIRVLPMVPGTLMIFRGRRSLHRVTPVEGYTSRCVALLAYDTRPDADSTDLFKLVRYGRSDAIETESAPD